MDWSPQQLVALDKVAKWLRNPREQVFYLAGYAGTGKTTIAKHLVAGVEGLCLQGAYTGKAASVLRKRGFPNAATLHSLLYTVYDPDKTALNELTLKLKDMEAFPDDYTEKEVKKVKERIKEEKDRLKGPHFTINPDSPLHGASLLLVDEVSMVGQDLGHDLLSFGKKVLVLGDPAQLPPVRGTGFFTSRKPDHILTEIHRQAADNPIIQWSKTIREGKELPFSVSEDGAARKLHKSDITTSTLAEAGQVLTGKNETRRNINRGIRKVLGRTSRYPIEGDKLVCLRNDKELGVLNGVLCYADSDAFYDEIDDYHSITLNYEDRAEPLWVGMDPKPFDAYRDADLDDGFMDRSLLQLDFGYALTVHKSQGSQWEDVLVADDGFAKWDKGMRAKWLYTAVTRAEETLTIVTG